jgi:hypothetical protein
MVIWEFQLGKVKDRCPFVDVSHLICTSTLILSDLKLYRFAYIIVFEFLMRFPEDSIPEQRVVSGLPALWLGLDHPGQYL